MTLNEILANYASSEEQITALKHKELQVPAWTGPKGLEGQYDPAKHPVNDKAKYPDLVEDGRPVAVTRIGLPFQKLAANRMSQLVTGIPVKRVFKPENDKQKEVAAVLNKILERNRIESLDQDRCERYFSQCEVMTLWFATATPNSQYGIKSPLKFRARTFSPKDGDQLYPLFDEDGDMVAMSVGYRRLVGDKEVNFFDAYGPDRHCKWSDETGEWKLIVDERIALGKIPAVYMWRRQPVWEDTSDMVYEMEWSLSRNGNYLRENSKPVFCVFADEAIKYGDEKRPEQEFRSIMQFPRGSSAQYITWPQATESLSFFIGQLRNLFFTTLQLPDWSYEKMSQTAMSGESRKQLFIDAQLKVKSEKGELIKFFDREINVLKAFVKAIMPDGYEEDIDALQCEIIITPFTIADDKETVAVLQLANGGKPVMSQRESVERLGWSGDVESTMQELEQEAMAEAQSVFNPIDNEQ